MRNRMLSLHPFGAASHAPRELCPRAFLARPWPLVLAAKLQLRFRSQLSPGRLRLPFVQAPTGTRRRDVQLDRGPPSADQGRRSFGCLGHSFEKVSHIYGGAAYPAFAQFASLSDQHQQNISETSAQARHISELSAEGQTNIRGTSEEHQNIRGISEKHQRNISQSGCVQVDIRYASVNHQLCSQRQTVNCA